MSKTKRFLLNLTINIFVLFAQGVTHAQISWQEVLPWATFSPTLMEYNYRAISFSDPKNCTMIGEFTDTAAYRMGIILRRSTDGGLTWKNQESGIHSFHTIHDAHLEQIFAIDSLNIVAVGDSGLIIRTTDAGNTWVQLGKTERWSLSDVSFSDPDHGIAVGNYGTVCITSNGGETWSVRELLTSSSFSIARAFRNGCYYVFDRFYNRFFRTYNAGLTWDSVRIVDPSLRDSLWSFVSDIHFFDSLHAIAVGGHQNSQGTFNFYIIKTLDGGNSWIQVMDTNYVFRELWSVSFTDLLLGAASSASGEVILTRDGGKTWGINIVDSDRLYITGIYFTDRKHLLAINNRGFFSSVMYGTLQDAGVVDDIPVIPDGITVYPNPILSEATISYALSSESEVHCIIQDILGRQLKSLYLGYRDIGRHKFRIDASRFPAGTYYYTIEAEGKRVTKQIIVIR